MINKRQEVLLASIIEKFIRTAEPVSSKFLEKIGFFGLSSATIRAEMNELEEAGFLAHLYTSSGRVPTDIAYRYYVDNVLSQEDLNAEPKESDKKRIRSVLASVSNDPREITKAIAQILSDLSENLVIAGIEEGQDFFKVGLSSLFGMPEFREFDRAFRLTSFFDGFEDLFGEIEKEFFGVGRHRRDNYKQNDIRVFIGRENPLENIRDETVMFAKYDLPKDYTGSITLIGPTRMDYVKNLNLIKYATSELNKIARKS